MYGSRVWLLLWSVLWILVPAIVGRADDLSGVVVRFEKYEGPATLVVRSVDVHKLKIDVAPRTERAALAIRVELPATGRNAWPIGDVEVRDSQGHALVVRRSGIEWHKLLIPVRAERRSYFVQAVDPLGTRQPLRAEQERQLTDSVTKVNISIARWYDGRQAALSLRFDDSHPTHLTKAIPILREYGFRGTFMINPGADEPGSRRRSDFQTHRAEWEAVARAGDQELANHTAHHRGATGDADMEAEIGDAARAIWKLTPGKSKLTALNLGGGTQWETSRTLRHYLDKYHQFDSPGSLGMDDVYGQRVAAFQKHIEGHIQRGLWCRVHFHYIGEGLSSSEANFRAALDVAAQRKSALWIAGMADIHKYQTERNGSALSLVNSDPRRVTFKLSSQTDPDLYDHPLTLEVRVPAPWTPDQIAVKDGHDKAVGLRRVQTGPETILRLDVPARTAEYCIELSP